MDPLVRQGLILGGAALVAGIAYAIDAWWWWSPSRRRTRARKWAERHVTAYDDTWLIPFEQQGVTNRRVAAIGTFLALVVLVEIPMGGQPYAAWLMSIPPLFAIVFGLSGAQISLPRGTRVARLRELELADYLPEAMRRFMWVAGAVGCLACFLVAVVRSEWLLGISGLLMLVAPASVELAARRLARTPEPAQGAAHLYLQDVLRADHIRGAALMSALSGAFLCNWLSTAEDPDWVWAVLMAMNVALLAGIYLFALKPGKPSTYMRSRLWPELRPGQLLSGADPMSTVGVAR